MMDADGTFRRLRGALGNAVVWGAGWASLALAVFAALKVTGILPASVHLLDAIGMSVKFGFMGGIAGGAFSAFIGVVYRGRRLSEISPVRFGIGGGLMAGIFVPAFLQTMNLLSGGGLVPMGLVADDALWSAVFGAVVAGGSLKLAQRADPLLPGGRRQDRPGLPGSGHRPAWEEARDLRPREAPARRSAED
jgi:hypothetical protein